MEATVRELMGPAFLVLGVSHVTASADWVRFFTVIRDTKVAGLIIGMYTLPVGLLLLVGHPRWTWEPAVFLTVAGYGLTFKSTLYFVAPRFADAMIERNMAKSPWGYRAAGAVMAVIGGIITWQAWALRLSA